MINFKRLKGKAGLLQAYKDVFCVNEAATRKVLDDLIDAANFNNPSYVPGRDPLDMAYREGQKAIVYRILACLRYDEDYMGRINMLLEAKERQILNQEYYHE